MQPADTQKFIVNPSRLPRSEQFGLTPTTPKLGKNLQGRVAEEFNLVVDRLIEQGFESAIRICFVELVDAFPKDYRHSIYLLNPRRITDPDTTFAVRFDLLLTFSRSCSRSVRSRPKDQ